MGVKSTETLTRTEALRRIDEEERKTGQRKRSNKELEDYLEALCEQNGDRFVNFLVIDG